MRDLISFLLWLSLLLLVAKGFWTLLRALVIDPLMKPVLLPLLRMLEPLLRPVREAIESALSGMRRWLSR